MSTIEQTETAAPAAACGQSAAPATSCGQQAAEAPSSCGQAAAAPASTSCGQAPAPATSCGQSAAAAEQPATGSCGQSASASETACAQSSAASSCGAPAQARYLDTTEMNAWRAFLTASTAVTAKLNHELEAGAGISMHEYEILVRLSEAEEHTLRMSALAENVSHSRSRLTHTVGRLEKAGYVERTACTMDKRGVNCHLTAEGEDFLRTAAPIHLDGVRRHVIDHLDREQLSELTVLLHSLVEPGDVEI
ncbi:MarR family winged helix-turn-helix transcriptional regulator [Actinomyces radicidentis]|nr:MarR family transcriptional regulator [Actinomyces radicidentis]